MINMVGHQQAARNNLAWKRFSPQSFNTRRIHLNRPEYTMGHSAQCHCDNNGYTHFTSNNCLDVETLAKSSSRMKIFAALPKP
jgi:hypothetical protein